jgi:hypothetical protein
MRKNPSALINIQRDLSQQRSGAKRARVHLVYLVCFVYLVRLVQADKPKKPNKQEKPAGSRVLRTTICIEKDDSDCIAAVVS